MTRSRSVALLALVGGLFVSACAPRVQDTPFTGFRGGDADALTLRVDNQNFVDMRILSLGSRGRQPVGIVDGKSRGTFQITWRAAGEIQFRLEEVGGGDDFITNVLSVSPGERIDMVIPDLARDAYIRLRR